MKYYYERPEFWMAIEHRIYECNHPLYDRGTLFTDDSDEKGLVVVQQRFNTKTKMSWWGPIDPWLVDDIVECADWNTWFNEHCDFKDEHGLYPTYPVRKVMWAMRMKPLERTIFERWYAGGK